MRIPQKKGQKGSLKWIQILINNYSHVVDDQLGHKVDWLSPLENDEYAEYRDESFLNILGLKYLYFSLKNFWPNNGPQWDALGISGKKYFLVEAKANIPETISSCSAKNSKSIAMIGRALNETKSFYNITCSEEWLAGFYQYANRLAHLYFLRETCKVDVELVFIYFCNDPTHISTSVSQWKRAITDQRRIMGLPEFQYLSELFIDCESLTS